MGADIYLRSVNDKARAEWEPRFKAAVAARDAKYRDKGLPVPEGDPLQQAVEEAYDKMNGEGYFRDSYNSTSLFWLLDFSWWSFDGYDKTGHMPVPAMKRLLAAIENKPITDEMMQRWHVKNAGRAKIDDGENSVEAWKEMFVAKRERLMALLRQAIELNEPLYCSV